MTEQSSLPVSVQVLTGSLCELVACDLTARSDAKEGSARLNHDAAFYKVLRAFKSSIKEALAASVTDKMPIQSCSVLLASRLDDACSALLAQDVHQLHADPSYTLDAESTSGNPRNGVACRLVIVPAFEETDAIATELCGTVYTDCHIAELPYTQLLAKIDDCLNQLEKTL